MLLDQAWRPRVEHLRHFVRGVSAGAAVDLLVVGLGPAGSRAACIAARAGWRVLAVERRQRAGEPVQCAELVPALLNQEVAGLARYVSQGIVGMETYIEDDLRDVTPDFPGAMIDRAQFDAALAGEACEAGAGCRYGIALAKMESDGTAQLSDGTLVRARVIVGADGPRSRVGRAARRVNRELVETRQVTVPLARAHCATDIFLSSDMPGGYGWLFPKAAVAHVGVGVAPWARARLKPLLETLHERLVCEGRVGREVLRRTGGSIPVGGMLEPAGRLGHVPVLLAGDAAGLAHPVSGAGIAAAVQSGALAGAAVAAWLGGEEGAPARYYEELAELFGPGLSRGLARREELLAAHRSSAGVTPAALRRGWIAYPEYWAA